MALQPSLTDLAIHALFHGFGELLATHPEVGLLMM